MIDEETSLAAEKKLGREVMNIDFTTPASFEIKPKDRTLKLFLRERPSCLTSSGAFGCQTEKCLLTKTCTGWSGLDTAAFVSRVT